METKANLPLQQVDSNIAAMDDAEKQYEETRRYTRYGVTGICGTIGGILGAILGAGVGAGLGVAAGLAIGNKAAEKLDKKVEKKVNETEVVEGVSVG